MFRDEELETVGGGDANFALQPGDDGHKKTITPFHGEIEEEGEHGYRCTTTPLDLYDSTHQMDDPFEKPKLLIIYFK